MESMSQPLLVQEITDDEEENNKNCTVDENSENCTKIKAKEHHSNNRLEDNNTASNVENVDREKIVEDTNTSTPEKRTLGQYRAHLRTRCEAECGRWARVTCSLLPAAPPGTYRLLCVVRRRRNSGMNLELYKLSICQDKAPQILLFLCSGGQRCQQGGRDGGPLRGLRQAGQRG